MSIRDRASWRGNCRACIDPLEPRRLLFGGGDGGFDVPEGLVLNEIDINPPGANTPYSYLELRGKPGEVVADAYVIEVEGDIAQNPGKINSIIPIAGTIGSNGLLMVRSAQGFPANEAATTVVDRSFFDSPSVGFQVGSSTFVLVAHDASQGPFSLAVGDDLDAGNTRVLSLPGTIARIDSVGVLDGSNGDIAYGTILGPLGIPVAPDAPDAISRFYDNTTANSDAWFSGNLVGDGNDTRTYSEDDTQRSPNFPSDGILTPGGHLPREISSAFNYVGAQQSFSITFGSDVSSVASADDFALLNTTTQTQVQLAVGGTSPDGKTVQLNFVNTGGVASNVLRDGDYRLRINGGDILPVDYDIVFFFKNADFNHDRVVNFDDLLTLSQNYQVSSSATFAFGDANYDRVVNFDDLLILSQRYGSTIALASVAPRGQALKQRRNVREVGI